MLNCKRIFFNFVGKIILIQESKGEDLDFEQMKKKAMIQIKKKNEKLYLEVIDKEYRIANRLIKAAKNSH